MRRNDTTRSLLGRGSSSSGGATRGGTSEPGTSFLSSTFAAIGRLFGSGAKDRSLDEDSEEPEINEVVDRPLRAVRLRVDDDDDPHEDVGAVVSPLAEGPSFKEDLSEPGGARFDAGGEVLSPEGKNDSKESTGSRRSQESATTTRPIKARSWGQTIADTWRSGKQLLTAKTMEAGSRRAFWLRVFFSVFVLIFVFSFPPAHIALLNPRGKFCPHLVVAGRKFGPSCGRGVAPATTSKSGSVAPATTSKSGKNTSKGSEEGRSGKDGGDQKVKGKTEEVKAGGGGKSEKEESAGKTGAAGTDKKISETPKQQDKATANKEKSAGGGKNEAEDIDEEQSADKVSDESKREIRPRNFIPCLYSPSSREGVTFTSPTRIVRSVACFILCVQVVWGSGDWEWVKFPNAVMIWVLGSCDCDVGGLKLGGEKIPSP